MSLLSACCRLPVDGANQSILIGGWIELFDLVGRLRPRSVLLRGDPAPLRPQAPPPRQGFSDPREPRVLFGETYIPGSSRSHKPVEVSSNHLISASLSHEPLIFDSAVAEWPKEIKVGGGWGGGEVGRGEGRGGMRWINGYHPSDLAPAVGKVVDGGGRVPCRASRLWKISGAGAAAAVGYVGVLPNKDMIGISTRAASLSDLPRRERD